jgi:hypothetical protein
MQILFINILMDGASPSALATALAVAFVVPDLMIFYSCQALQVNRLALTLSIVR